MGKLELTPELKERFFAQYWGQKVLHVNDESEMNYLFEVDKGTFQLNLSGCYLVLRELPAITPEESIDLTLLSFPEISELQNEKKGVELLWNTLNSIRDSSNWLSTWDYLRCKGFALPFMGHSVEELVNAGWIKLIQ